MLKKILKVMGGLLVVLNLSLVADEKSTQEANIKSAREFLIALYAQDKTKVEQLLGDKYIQHNQNYKDGRESLLQALPYFNGSITIHRVFADGDFVVVHNEFSEGDNKGVGFDIFRFKDGKIVEHWDNLDAKLPPNKSGKTQIDGSATINNNVNTKASKTLVESFVKDILMKQNLSKINSYFNNGEFIQHSAYMPIDLAGVISVLEAGGKNEATLEYQKIHKILGSGNFVLVIGEGEFSKNHKDTLKRVAFYDLFRTDKDKIVEHWDIIEPILTPKEAQNSNGKFGFGNF